MPRPRLNVAICGGGPGGLSLAVVLGKYCSDVHVDLYEAAPQLTEIGAGISVWKRTWYIMQQLGLDASLGEMAVKPPVEEIKLGFILRKGDEKESGFNFSQMMTPYGSITLHRRDMLKVLTDNLPPPPQFTPHFSKRLVSYTQNPSSFDSSDSSDSPNSGSVTMHFEDGSSAQADLLIGADGIRSATRAVMYNDLAKRLEEEDEKRSAELLKLAKPIWSGIYAYRALIDMEKLLSRYPGHQAASIPMIYCGKDKHLVTYPISQGRVVNFIAFVTVAGGEGTQLEGPAMVDVEKEEVTSQFVTWEPEALNLLDCIEKPSRWAISHIRGLPTYVDGRVALLGDAAHAMTTHLGAGAGQSIEDAYTLGQILSSPLTTLSTIPTALGIYDSTRRPFASSVVERSRSTGFLYEFNELPPEIDEEKLRSGDKTELKKLEEAVYEKWTMQWSALPDVEWREARGMLEELSLSSRGESASAS